MHGGNSDDRKRAAFAELERAFIKYKIPFTVIGGRGFFQQQNISDIYNYFAFLFDSGDDAALIGLLRSPFFSVSDMEIFQLSFFDGDSYWEKLMNAAGTDEYWKPYYSTIKENLNLLERISVPTLLQKILDESEFLSVIASRNNSEQEISNINKLISITIRFFEQEFNSLYDYLTFLKNSISSFIEESQAAIEDKSNCVNIMTIHQAKGLQYSAVFLYRCNDTSQSESIKARSFEADKNFGLLTKVPCNDNYFGEYYSAPLVDLFNFIENKKSRAELKRLLYVGITKAKNYLFISARENKSRTNKLNSFIDLLTYALDVDLMQDGFTMKGNLNFLVKSKSEHKVVNHLVSIQVPLLRDIELKETIDARKSDNRIHHHFLTEALDDHSKGEIISATKFSVFKDCPLKYNLIYNFNLNPVLHSHSHWLKTFMRKDDYEFNSNEQRRIIFEESNSKSLIDPDIKGRIIHRILRAQKPYEGIQKTINNLFGTQKYFRGKNLQTNEKLREELVKTIKRFYESKEHIYLSSFSTYKNEFEVYCREDDYYLFGIIDKVLFAENKITVVDYKTDAIGKSEISERGKKYLSQLYFYSYILKRLYPSIPEFEMRIIFLGYPDQPFVKKLSENDEIKTLSDLKSLITSIRNNNYSVNLNHCSQCIFYINNKNCIVSQNRIKVFTHNDLN